MSADAQAPELKVRFSKRDEKNGGEQEEVDICETLDQSPPDPRPHEVRPLTEGRPAAVRRRAFKATAVILGVLYLVILAGIYMRNIFVTLERDQLSNSYSQLQGKVSDLSSNHSQLQAEVKKLQDKMKKKRCPEGWRRFGCSCYFKSKGRKTWDESRADCQRNGADLVVINNQEEQNFVLELNKDEESWIGLRAGKEIWNQIRWKWEWQWEWVDRSPQTNTFWATGLPKYDTNNKAATCCNKQGQWTESYSSDSKKWICEK